MKNIYVLSGEETVLKDNRIKEICSSLDSYEYKSIYIEPYRSEKYNFILDEANLFLSAYDFFSSSKVLRIILDKPEQIKPIMSGINIIGDENIIIIDLRCPEFLTKTLKVEYDNNTINIEKFYKFKDYQKDDANKYINELALSKGIKFISEEDKISSFDYIINNSQGSYSFIYNEINKLSLLKDNGTISFNEVLDIVGTLTNKNNYKTCDLIFNSNTVNDLIYCLEKNIGHLNKKSFNSFLLVLVNKIKDYKLLREGKKCLNKANYYTLKNSKLKILNPEKLILDINKLCIELKNNQTNSIPKEEFIWTLLEHIEF